MGDGQDDMSPGSVGSNSNSNNNFSHSSSNNSNNNSNSNKTNSSSPGCIIAKSESSQKMTVHPAANGDNVGGENRRRRWDSQPPSSILGVNFAKEVSKHAVISEKDTNIAEYEMNLEMNDVTDIPSPSNEQEYLEDFEDFEDDDSPKESNIPTTNAGATDSKDMKVSQNDASSNVHTPPRASIGEFKIGRIIKNAMQSPWDL